MEDKKTAKKKAKKERKSYDDMAYTDEKGSGTVNAPKGYEPKITKDIPKDILEMMKNTPIG